MKCDVCKHKIETARDSDPFCSEYCATTSDAEKAEYKKAKVGDYCIYPCRECGCAIEDNMDRSQVCGTCYPEWSMRKLLRRCKKYVPERLQKAIDKAVKR